MTPRVKRPVWRRGAHSDRAVLSRYVCERLGQSAGRFVYRMAVQVRERRSPPHHVAGHGDDPSHATIGIGSDVRSLLFVDGDLAGNNDGARCATRLDQGDFDTGEPLLIGVELDGVSCRLATAPRSVFLRLSAVAALRLGGLGIAALLASRAARVFTGAAGEQQPA